MVFSEKMGNKKSVHRIYVSEKELKEFEGNTATSVIRHWLALGKERAEKEALSEQVNVLKDEILTVKDEVEKLTHLVAQMGHLIVAMTTKDHQDLAEIRRKVKGKMATNQEQEASKIYDAKMKNYTDYLSSNFPAIESSAFLKFSDSSKD